MSEDSNGQLRSSESVHARSGAGGSHATAYPLRCGIMRPHQIHKTIAIGDPITWAYLSLSVTWATVRTRSYPFARLCHFNAASTLLHYCSLLLATELLLCRANALGLPN